ncbi:MAG TPA: hypothetical protein DEB47_07280 [Citreicella sp.]|nr:hypothetical protein [Citreicella sp.]
MRFSSTGSLGALFFIGSIAGSGYSYTTMMEGLVRGDLPSGITADPLLYVVLSTIGALGVVMMIGGREIVSQEVHDQEERTHGRRANRSDQ